MNTVEHILVILVLVGIAHGFLENCSGSHHCNDHGTMSWCKCHCNTGWEGKHCETRTGTSSHTGGSHSECRYTNCHHGDCHYEGIHERCTCHDGYFGSHCTYENPCHKSNPCQNGGTCHLDFHNTHHYSCSCAQGFTGQTCGETVHHVKPVVVKTTLKPSTTTKTSTTTTTTTTPKPTTSTTTATTTTKPTTTTTTAAPTTQPTHAPRHYTCEPVQTITDLSGHTVSINANASQCPSGENKDSDAFVMNHCNVDVPMLWRQGQNVFANCLNIPLYTPIATFDQGRFNANTGTAAVFTGCVANGIRVGLQTCDKGVRIEHFDVTNTNYQDAKKYYTIQ